MTPAVSVIIAAYNGAALVTETLRSLTAQTLRDWEAVVVDDCSTDDTLAMLRAYPDPRVRVIAAERNGGPVRARNLAVSHAKGHYLAALDHDDLCRPERLARQVAYLERHPDVVLLGTQATMLAGETVRPSGYAPHTTPALIEWLLLIENPLVWSSVMVRGAVARALEPFTRPELLYAEDFDLYHRLSRVGRIARLDDELVLYRQHAGGMSKRFVDAMGASATAVMAEAYAPILGEEARDAAALVVRHVMAQVAVPDRATLHRLGRVLTLVQAHHLASRPLSRDDRKLIRWETARRWARVGRAALRTGAVGLGDVVSARPPHLGLGYAGVDQLLWSGLVGGTRRLGQTFAE